MGYVGRHSKRLDSQHTRNHMEITNQQLAQIRSIFPEAQIETDNDGQIIIYTGLYEIEE